MNTMSLIDTLPMRFTRLASQMLREAYNEFGDLAPINIPVPSCISAAPFNIDVFSDQDVLTVKADMPGMDKDNVAITLSEDNVLTISGERSSDIKRKEDGKVYQREIKYGKFTRSIQLAQECDTASIQAKLDNGVLTVIVPKRKPPQTAIRKVQID